MAVLLISNGRFPFAIPPLICLSYGTQAKTDSWLKLLILMETVWLVSVLVKKTNRSLVARGSLASTIAWKIPTTARTRLRCFLIVGREMAYGRCGSTEKR